MGKSYRVTIEDDYEDNTGCAILIGVVIVGWLIIENAATIFTAILVVALAIGAMFCLWKGIQGIRKVKRAKAHAVALERESKSITAASFGDLESATNGLLELLDSWEMMKCTQGIGTPAEGIFRRIKVNKDLPSLTHLQEAEEAAVRTLSDALQSRSALESSLGHETETTDSIQEAEIQALLLEKTAEVRTADRQLRAAIFYATLHN